MTSTSSAYTRLKEWTPTKMRKMRSPKGTALQPHEPPWEVVSAYGVLKYWKIILTMNVSAALNLGDVLGWDTLLSQFNWKN